MSRDFDDIYKKIDQSHKDLYKQDNAIIKDLVDMGKDQEKILTEIKDIKKQVKNIETKVDLILEILNNFTILLAEEEGADDYGNEDDSDSWMHDKEESWNSYDDDEEDEDM